MDLTDKIAGIIVAIAGLIFVLFGLLIGLGSGGLILLLFGGIILLVGIYFLITSKDQNKKSAKPSAQKIAPKKVSAPSQPMHQQIRNQISLIRKAVSGSVSPKTPKPKEIKINNDIERRKHEALRRIKEVHKRR
ncbi:MAG TPA: hypothetical protein VHA12_01040 [Candidatus Nanoarchaeia archaeon]|nr:hypothetical protein [Candidatus Nanoarchaeia archaeon]